MEESGFEIRDKRLRFNEEGSPAPVNQKAEKEPPPLKTEKAESPYIPVTFASFILSLATSALVHLGQQINPETGQQTISLSAARQSIDLLALLQEKTKGNLTREEESLLSETLFALQMRFVDIEHKQTAGRP